jgi:fibronectin-binding autotransporter adhesin
MSIYHLLSRPVLAAATALLLISPLHAQLIWDANGTTSGQTNGAGTWSATNQWWTGSANTTWANTGSEIAQIGTVASATGGAITAASPINLAGLNFSSLSGTPTSTHSITGGTLSFGSSQTIQLADSVSTSNIFVIISSAITAANLTVQKSSGTAHQFIRFDNTANSLSGTLTVAGNNGGVFLRIAAPGTLGTVSQVNVAANSSAALQGTGLTYTQNFQISGSGDTTRGALRIDSSNLSLNGNIVMTGDSTLNINGGVNNTTINGVISESGGVRNFTRISSGAGQVVRLTAANTYTGTTTLGAATGISGGITTLDFTAAAAPTTNILYNEVTAAALNMAGGTGGATILSLTGKAGTTNTQTLGAVAVTGTMSAISATSGAGGSMSLTTGSVSRGSNAAIAFTAPASGSMTVGNSPGFLGAWTTYTSGTGASSWANVQSGGVLGNFTGTLPYTTGSTLGSLANASSNVTLSGVSTGNVTISGATTTINTLSMTDSCLPRILAIGGTDILRVGGSSAGGGGNVSGGFQMVTGAQSLTIGSSVGAGVITGGGAANTAGQISFTNFSTQPMIVNSAINNNGTGGQNVLINGTGRVIFNAGGSYGADTIVASGILEIRNSNALGTTASNNTRVLDGAALQIGGGISTPEPIALSGTGISNGGAIRNVDGNNSFTGLVTLISGSRINSDSGTLTFSATTAATSAITGTNTIVVGGAGTVVISGRLNITSGVLTKDGSGTLILSGDNSFTSTTSHTEGVLRAASATGLGGTSGSTTVSSGASLEFTGGLTFNARPITASGSGINSGGAIRSISGANTLTAPITMNASLRINADSGSTLTLDTTSTVSNNSTSNRTVTLGGAGDIIALGAISRTSSGTLGLTKDGAGTVTLRAANVTDGLTTVSAGTLHLDFTAATSPSSDIVNSGVATPGGLTLAGGTLQTTGKSGSATSQRFGNVTVSPGFSTISQTLGSATSVTTTAGTISRTFGSSLQFTLPAGTAFQLADGADNTILTKGGVAFATVGTSDWAATGVLSSGTRPVVGLSTLAGGYASSTATTLTGNADAAVTTTTLAADASPTSLRFNATQATSVGGSAGTILSTGGILVTPNVGTNDTLISVPTLRTSATSSPELVIFQNNTQGDLIISSAVTNNEADAVTSMVKTGAGTLAFTGVSTFTGTLRAHEGTVHVRAGGVLPATLDLELGSGTRSARFILGSGTTARTISVDEVDGLGVGTGNAILGGATATSIFTINSTATSTLTNVTIGGTGTNENNLALDAFGGATVQLGSNNSYNGYTNIGRATFEVTLMANSGSNSSLGTGSTSPTIDMNSTSSTAAVVSILRYVGTADSSTNRPVRLHTNTSSAPSLTAGIENNGTGTLKFTAAFTATGTNTTQRLLQLGGTNTGLNEIVSIGDNGSTATVRLEKNGLGRWALTGNSSYTGGTTVTAGTLQLGTGGTAGMVGSGDVAISSGAILALSRSNAHTLANNITGAGSVIISNGSTGVTTLSSNANTYSGGTVISTGSLFVTNTTGSATGTGAVTVAPGATLGGDGRIAPASGAGLLICGNLSIGTSSSTAADMDILTSGSGGSLTIDSSGALVFDLISGAGSGTLNAAASADRLLIGGSLTLNTGSTLRVQNLNSLTGWSLGDSWRLLDWTTLTGTATGTFTTFDLPTLTGGLLWDTTQIYSLGTLTIVPEPNRLLLLPLGLLSLLARRRR